MLAASVVAVSMMLGSHFEAPREEKFQLLAQAPETTKSANQRELEKLISTRPTYVPGVIVVGVGTGVGLLGVLFIGLAFIEYNSLAGTIGLVAGLLFVPTGVVGLIIGVVMLIVTAIARGVTDARVRKLESLEVGAARAAIETSRGFVLARF